MKNELRNGPLVGLLNGASDPFQMYRGGILDDVKCTNVQDHAIVIAGYGEENGVPYWLIKNSWGGFYGENGFIRIRMGVNMCGVEVSAFRPIV